MKPRIITRCVANQHTGNNERIIEFTHKGKGGLIAFTELDNGELRVSIYRVDDGVQVIAPAQKQAQP